MFKNNVPINSFSRLLGPLLLLCLPLTILAQQAEPTATLFLHVNANYDDSEASLKQVKMLMKYLEPAKETLKVGETIPQFIYEHYKITRTRLPETYKLIEVEILRLNNWLKVSDSQPGESLLPQIPEWSIKPPFESARKNRRLGMADINLLEQLTLGTMTSATIIGNPDMELPSLENEPGTIADEVVIPVVLPVNELMTDEGKNLLNAEGTESVEGPMRIKFGGSVPNNLEEIHILSDTERETISHLIKNNVQRSTVVFILDSGWPNLEAFNESTKVLLTAFDDIWDRWGVDSSKRPKRETELTVLKNPLHKHCQTIEQGLREFRSLDPEKKIRVVYLPLILGQNADSVLQELLEIHFIARAKFRGRMGQKNDKLNLSASNNDKKILATGKKLAADTIKTLQEHAKKLEEDPDGASIDIDDVTSNKGILQATFAIAQFIAARDNSVFFINESWTVESSLLSDYTSPNEMFGMPIAAVGNVANLVVTGTDDGVDFARRSFHKKDVVAVMNYRNGPGKQCDTSIVNETLLDDTQVVGYDGRVSTDQHGCQTSYAAPRIAWLLACAEAIRPNLPSRVLWAPDLEKRLKRNRSQAQGLDSTIFDPIPFLQASLTN